MVGADEVDLPAVVPVAGAGGDAGIKDEGEQARLKGGIVTEAEVLLAVFVVEGADNTGDTVGAFHLTQTRDIVAHIRGIVAVSLLEVPCFPMVQAGDHLAVAAVEDLLHTPHTGIGLGFLTQLVDGGAAVVVAVVVSVVVEPQDTVATAGHGGGELPAQIVLGRHAVAEVADGKEGIPHLDALTLACGGVLIEVVEVGIGALLLGVHLPVAIVADEGTARGVDEVVQPVLESLAAQEVGLDAQPVGVEIQEGRQLGGYLAHDLISADASGKLLGLQGLVADEEAQGGGMMAEVGVGALVDGAEGLGILLEVVEIQVVDVNEGLHVVLVHLVKEGGHECGVMVAVAEGGGLIAGDAAVIPAGHLGYGGGSNGGVIPESNGIFCHDVGSFRFCVGDSIGCFLSLPQRGRGTAIAVDEESR